MIEDPCFAGHVRRCLRLIQETVDVKPHDVRFPLDGKGVKIVGKLLAVGQRVRRAYAVRARVTRSMKSAVNDRRFLTDVFHDVDLAASGPSRGADVVAQHPKRRPDALAVGNLYSRLKTSVGLAELIPGQQSRRSVITSEAVGTGKSFFERLDCQHSAFEIRVCRAARIRLEFAVTPAVAAKIKGPLACINRRAVRTIELVTPHQAPNCRIAGIRYWPRR